MQRYAVQRMLDGKWRTVYKYNILDYACIVMGNHYRSRVDSIPHRVLDRTTGEIVAQAGNPEPDDKDIF